MVERKITKDTIKDFITKHDKGASLEYYNLLMEFYPKVKCVKHWTHLQSEYIEIDINSNILHTDIYMMLAVEVEEVKVKTYQNKLRIILQNFQPKYQNIP